MSIEAEGLAGIANGDGAASCAAPSVVVGTVETGVTGGLATLQAGGLARVFLFLSFQME